MSIDEKWTEPTEALLRTWKFQIDKRRKVHIRISKLHIKRYYILGVTASIFSAFVSSNVVTIFSTDRQQSGWLIFILLCSITSTVLSGIQTFFNYSKSSQTHVSAADSYDALYRSIDTILKLPREMRDSPDKVLKDIQGSYDDIIKTSPTLEDMQEIIELREMTMSDKSSERAFSRTDSQVINLFCTEKNKIRAERSGKNSVNTTPISSTTPKSEHGSIREDQSSIETRQEPKLETKIDVIPEASNESSPPISPSTSQLNVVTPSPPPPPPVRAQSPPRQHVQNERGYNMHSYFNQKAS